MDTLPKPGDVITATVVKAVPFGVLVKTDKGTAGLVRGATSKLGATLRVRVVEADPEQTRFRAEQT